MRIWGNSYKYKKNLRLKIGAGKTDWRTFHFKRSDTLKPDRYHNLDIDFPSENLPLFEGALVIGLGAGDQQIWISTVTLTRFPAAK